MEYEVLDKGARIKVQPGLVGARVNQILAPFGKKIGPDPASINAVCGGLFFLEGFGKSHRRRFLWCPFPPLMA